MIGPFADQLAGPFANVFDSGVDSFAHQPACAFANVFDGGADALDELLDDLRVAVYRRKHPVDYGGHVI